MFSCECGRTRKDWINPNVKRICNFCGSEIKNRDISIQTRLEAFNQLDEEMLNKRHTQVINALEELRTANNRMIAEYLKLPINSITPRVKELREKGLIIEDCVREDNVTNRKTIYWSVL